MNPIWILSLFLVVTANAAETPQFYRVRQREQTYQGYAEPQYNPNPSSNTLVLKPCGGSVLMKFTKPDAKWDKTDPCGSGKPLSVRLMNTSGQLNWNLNEKAFAWLEGDYVMVSFSYKDSDSSIERWLRGNLDDSQMSQLKARKDSTVFWSITLSSGEEKLQTAFRDADGPIVSEPQKVRESCLRSPKGFNAWISQPQR
ncbi:MAG TPA: hypothetical protein VFA77_16045 [Candidatus Eisenbacteria bacterium]|nr:hypothetical protein [Candidatus Eisenbacteria bacterium]